METLWTPAALFGALIAEAELELVPAWSWPLEAAIESLADPDRPEDGLSLAARHWLEPRPGSAGRVRGVAAWLRDAAEAGLLVPEGEGWDAGYRPQTTWIVRARKMKAVLIPSEATALREAAQTLVAMSTMLWKKAAA
jgi:hypothetical protein